MTGTRIYAPTEYTSNAVVELPDGARDHLRARRLRPGDALTLFDGAGRGAEAQLETLQRKVATARIAHTWEGGPESALAPTLIQGLGKGDAIDTVVQKATELGAAQILPVYSDNTSVRLDAERAPRKQAHWQRVAISACEQCGRNTLPGVHPPQALDAALAGLDKPAGVVVSAEASLGMGALPAVAREITLAVGPEGGFSDHEIEDLAARGWSVCHLGPRVLRMETAAIAGLTALGLRFGDLG